MKHVKPFIALMLLFCLLCGTASAKVYTFEDGREVSLSAGGSFAYARNADGALTVWGDNQYGQLGRGGTAQGFQVRAFKTKNEQIDPLQVRDVITASDYSFLFMRDGSLFAVGNNAYQSFGKREGSFTTHVAFSLPETPVTLECGFGHTLALTESGHVYAWGRNCHGQVGNGGTKKTAEPYRVPIENIVQIVCGGKFSLALAQDGTLWGWGDNEFHTLRADTTKSQLTPVQVDTAGIRVARIEACGASVALLDEDGALWTWGRNDMQQLGYDTNGQATDKPARVPFDLPVLDVTAYSSQTYAILSDGSLWSWGNNSYGQLGQGFRSAASEGVLPGKCWNEDVVLVTSGSLFVLAMLKDGTVLSAGISKFGQLGRGDGKSQYTLSPNGMNLHVAVTP